MSGTEKAVRGPIVEVPMAPRLKFKGVALKSKKKALKTGYGKTKIGAYPKNYWDEKEVEEEEIDYEEDEVEREEGKEEGEEKEKLSRVTGQPGYIARGTEYESKQVKIFSGYLEELAKKLRTKLNVNIPLYEERIVKVESEYKVYDADIVFKAKQKMRPIAMGYMEPVKLYTKFSGEEYLPSYKFKSFEPDQKKIENPHNKKYPIGTRVSFKIEVEIKKLGYQKKKVAVSKRKLQTIEGVVVDFDERELIVLEEGRYFRVKYQDPTLRILKREKKERVKLELNRPTLISIYSSSVPDKIREDIIDHYTKILEGIKGVSSKEEKGSPVPQPLPKPLPWEEYYANNFQRWLYSKKYKEIKESLDLPSLYERAKEIAQAQSDPQEIIANIYSTFPGGISTQTTNVDLYNFLKDKRDITLIEARLLTALEASVFRLKLVMWEAAGVTILCLVFLAILASYIFSVRYQNLISNNVITKGMNGVAGQQINLSCPAGQVISFSQGNKTVYGGGNGRGVLICNDSKTCDPFWQGGGQTNSFFNTDNTIDAFTSSLSAFAGLKNCQGQNSCTWTVPTTDPSTGMCTGNKCNGNLEFVGTYDCVPNSS